MFVFLSHPTFQSHIHTLTHTSTQVIGTPDRALAARMAAAEQERVAAQRAALGEAGLARHSDRLKAALLGNERAPPQEVSR